MHASKMTMAVVSDGSMSSGSSEEEMRNARAHCRCHNPRVTCPSLA